MNSTKSYTRTDIPKHGGARYTVQSIANAHNVAESTVRTRWFAWICRVAPAELLKDGQGYTELARSLFGEFAQLEKCDRTPWVTEAKTRYAKEWASAGVIDAELMPDSVSSALALRQSQTGAMTQATALELSELEDFVDQLVVTEADFSTAELAAFKAAGQRRGMIRFKVETQAEMDTYSTLKQRRMGTLNG